MNDITIPPHKLPAMLRAARLFAGLRQSELAEVLGVGRTALASWEYGKRNPKGDDVHAWVVERIDSLADRLQYLIRLLAMEDENGNPPESVDLTGDDSAYLLTFLTAALALSLGIRPEFGID